MELRRDINNLRRDVANGAVQPADIASERRLLGEILEAVGVLQDQMAEVIERLDRLENPSGS